VSPEETIAKRIVELIDELFGIDAEARARGCDVATRHGLRQERVPALLESIKQKIEAARQQALPPASWQRHRLHAQPLAEADALSGLSELELSNNLAENSMRPVALGRKNWIHVAARKLVRKWPPSCRSSKRADAFLFRSGITSPMSCGLGRRQDPAVAQLTPPLVGTESVASLVNLCLV